MALAIGSQTIALLAYGFGYRKPNHCLTGLQVFGQFLQAFFIQDGYALGFEGDQFLVF